MKVEEEVEMRKKQTNKQTIKKLQNKRIKYMIK